MGSWEQMCEELVVQGDPGELRSLGQMWGVLATEVTNAAAGIRDGAKDMTWWQGEAADAFRKRLGELADRLERFSGDYAPVQDMLSTSAQSLEGAQRMVPIPDALRGKIEAARAHAL